MKTLEFRNSLIGRDGIQVRGPRDIVEDIVDLTPNQYFTLYRKTIWYDLESGWAPWLL